MKPIQCLLILIILIFGRASYSQEAKAAIDAAYKKVIAERAAKIIMPLSIKDTLKAFRVQQIVANQYQNLNSFYESRKLNLQEIVHKKENTKTVNDSLSNVYLLKSDEKLAQLHKQYLKDLRKLLSKKQIEIIKNGMTYNVFPNTYRAYQEMIPTLTKAQKKQIYAYLNEAREHAMDAESSDKKHAWFGKYKGKINNYLSKEGIDMKEMSLAWEKKIREREEAKKIKN